MSAAMPHMIMLQRYSNAKKYALPSRAWEREKTKRKTTEPPTMKASITVFVLLFLLTSCTNSLNKPNNFNEVFNLQFRQQACSGKDSDPQHRELANNGNQFFAQLTTHFSCGTVAGNPEIFANGKSITLAVDSFSPSGMAAACFCSRTLEFDFTIPAEFEEYNFQFIAFTLNGALIDLVPIEEEFTVRRKQ